MHGRGAFPAARYDIDPAGSIDSAESVLNPRCRDPEKRENSATPEPGTERFLDFKGIQGFIPRFQRFFIVYRGHELAPVWNQFERNYEHFARK